MESTKSILMYLRKSRSDNPKESVEEVLSKHEDQLQRLAVSIFGEPIPEENIYREVVSGETIAARPMIQTVLGLMELDNIHGVMVTDPPRLTRGDLVDCGTVIKAFQYTNTKLYTLGRTYDLSDKFDRKFIEQDLLRGSDYLEYVKDVLSRGRRAAAVKGAYSHSVAPYGYRRVVVDGVHTLEPIPEQAAVIQMIYQWYATENIGTTKIAKRLRELSIPTPSGKNDWEYYVVHAILRNPVYAGKIRYGWRASVRTVTGGELVTSRPVAKDYILADGLHPAIVEPEIYDRVQKITGTRPRVPMNHDCKNILAGVLFCGTCGATMNYKTFHKNGVERSRPSFLCRRQSICHTKSVVADDLIDSLIRSLESSLEECRVQLRTGDIKPQTQYAAMMDSLTNERRGISEKEERLMDLLEEGIYSREEYLRRHAKLMTRREELDASIELLNEKLKKEPNLREREAGLMETLAALRDPNVPAKTKQSIISGVVERIVYTNATEPGHRWKVNEFTLDVFLRA